MKHSSKPIAHFYRVIDEARLPQRADRSAAGTLPTRAYRYCDAVTSAAGFGWWLFPPTDLQFHVGWARHLLAMHRLGGLVAADARSTIPRSFRSLRQGCARFACWMFATVPDRAS